MMNTDNVVEMTTEKKYTLRPLNATDVFLMSRILSKIGIDKFIKDIGIENLMKLSSGGENAVVQIGLDIALSALNAILCNLPACEKDVFKFLSNLSGMKEKEISEMDMVTFTEMVFDVAKKEEFRGFIKVVSSLFK